MTKAERLARNKLIEYAKKFLQVTTQPSDQISVTPEQIAAFAAQLREGCKQDLLRLIENCVDDALRATGKEALESLARAISEGETIELWGLPDCACGRQLCVYCGRGYATPPTKLTLAPAPSPEAPPTAG